jgi:tetratricopeptide (TPR) repeat protein
VFLYVFFITTLLNAQTSNPGDTIEFARSKAYEKNFTEADVLLTTYNLNHTDINALRLHAQILYWMQEIKRSSEVYEKALTSFPEMPVVKLDYGRMLFETGKLPHSQLLLEDYRLHDSSNAEVNILLSRLYYWSGHIKKAKARLQDVLKPYPDNPTALSILTEINNAAAPFIRMRGIYTSDDQPLESTGIELETGWYNSWLFNPKLLINYNHFTLFDSSFNSLWIQLGDKISFGHSGFSINVTGGIFKHPANNNSEVTGNVILAQKISNAFSLETFIAKRPYQYSSTSIRTPVMQTFSGAAVNFNKGNKWLGRAAYQLEKFEDDNKIQTIYLWLLAPIINKKNFSLKAGYAFNHSNADINKFASLKPLSNVVQTTAAGGMVEGYYNPYFTPNNQTIHSLLASLGIELSDKINFTSRLNIGVSASADNPDLILNKNQGNIYSINKVYVKQSYTPIDFQNELAIHLSSRLILTGLYGYTKLLFYTLNQGSIQLKYAFINEKK